MLLGQLAAVRSELEAMRFRDSPVPGSGVAAGLPDGGAEVKTDAVWWDEEKGATWLRERQVRPNTKTTTTTTTWLWARWKKAVVFRGDFRGLR